MKQIRENSSGEAHTKVVQENTAKAMKSGELEVFATPALVALMEEAAVASLASSLEPNETSVGVSISVNHTKASKLGSTVTAYATIEKAEGRKVDFSITAFDTVGEIGNATHSRVVVDRERFMGKL